MGEHLKKFYSEQYAVEIKSSGIFSKTYSVTIPEGNEKTIADTLSRLAADDKQKGMLELAKMEIKNGKLVIKGNSLAADILIQQNMIVDLSMDPPRATARVAAENIGGLFGDPKTFKALDKNGNGKIEFSDLDRNGDGKLTASDMEALEKAMPPKALEAMKNRLARNGVTFERDTAEPQAPAATASHLTAPPSRSR